MSVEFRGTHILVSHILVDYLLGVDLGKLGVGVGDVLHVAEGLHLGDDLHAKLTRVAKEFAHLVLFQDGAARAHARMGHLGL